MHITKLEVENVKRVTAVTIEPDGSMVVIGGKNGQGKSSTLDSIWYALGGNKAIPAVPIHEGAEEAKITVTTPKFIITRTFTAKGSYIKVTNTEGFVAGSPQALLDNLVGDLSFDPLAFTKMNAAAQAAAFQRLLGLDFKALDAEYSVLEAERRDVGRDMQGAKGLLTTIEENTELPEAEIVLNDILDQIKAAEATNRDNDFPRRELASWEKTIVDWQAEITGLEAKLLEAKESLAKAQANLEATRAKADACVDVDIEPLRQKLADAEQTNKLIRQQNQRKSYQQQYNNYKLAYDAKSDRLVAIKATKGKIIAEAEFPVPGVGFDSNGVTVNGLPFEQASQAEQLRIAVAMGLSANPELRIVLIRDGSLLDEDSLAAMGAMAEKYEAQVWMERVGSGAEVSVVIADGVVSEDRTKQEVE